MKKTLLLSVILLFWVVTAGSCGQRQTLLTIQGRTMGTSYSVKMYFDKGQKASMSAGIDSVLRSINRQMSTWDRESEISLFNAMSAGDTLIVSAEFSEVLVRSLHIHLLSRGAFDITVGPAVDWWGFGSGSVKLGQSQLPDSIKNVIGMGRLDFDSLPRLVKPVQGMRLDLSAVAKGYGVDAVGKYIMSRGCSNFLVEIGGELIARGQKADGSKWVLGIDKPEDMALPGEALSQVLELTDLGLATSGDYRNFRYVDGRRISHIMDPRTAMPVPAAVASVTVIAGDCTTADGLATALMVMNPEEGLALVDSLSGCEAYYIVRTRNEEFEELFSRGFRQYIMPQAK